MRCLIGTEKLESVEMDITQGKVGEEWSISLVKDGFPRNQVQMLQIWNQACWCGDGNRQEGNQKRLGDGWEMEDMT